MWNGRYMDWTGLDWTGLDQFHMINGDDIDLEFIERSTTCSDCDDDDDYSLSVQWQIVNLMYVCLVQYQRTGYNQQPAVVIVRQREKERVLCLKERRD